MNPLTKVKLINQLNERESSLGVKESVSWHQDYKDSAWIFLGGLPYQLSEGDIICVFSQYGEIVNINLVRDKSTGRSCGFCFLCYEDQRSTVLAVDNLNGIKVKGRTIRVDHVSNYRPPKDAEDIDEVTKILREKGCAARTPSPSPSEEEVVDDESQKRKKHKKKKRRKESESQLGERSGHERSKVVKKERDDPGYEKYNSKHTIPEQHNVQRRMKDKEDASGNKTQQKIYEKSEQKDHMLENKSQYGEKQSKQYDKRRH